MDKHPPDVCPGLNPSLSFRDLNEFTPFLSRLDHLVYDQGKMPLGLLNYSKFWDKNSGKLAILANTLGLSRTDSNGAAILPGKPIDFLRREEIALGQFGRIGFGWKQDRTVQPQITYKVIVG